jgi:hypothetical protein
MTNEQIDRTLVINFTKDRQGNPLAIVKNFPGLDAEFYADGLRKMAAELTRAADQLDGIEGAQHETNI